MTMVSGCLLLARIIFTYDIGMRIGIPISKYLLAVVVKANVLSSYEKYNVIPNYEMFCKKNIGSYRKKYK